jgi:hypothetical protein
VYDGCSVYTANGIKIKIGFIIQNGNQNCALHYSTLMINVHGSED